MDFKRFLLALILSLLVSLLCTSIGLDRFLSGWFSCTAYFAVMYWNKIKN